MLFADFLKEGETDQDHAFNLSGHGYLDLQAYANYREGKLFGHEHPEEDIRKALEKLPKL